MTIYAILNDAGTQVIETRDLGDNYTGSIRTGSDGNPRARPIVEVIPTYDPQTEELKSWSYVIQATRVLQNWIKGPIPPPPTKEERAASAFAPAGPAGTQDADLKRILREIIVELANYNFDLHAVLKYFVSSGQLNVPAGAPQDVKDAAQRINSARGLPITEAQLDTYVSRLLNG